MAWDGMGCVIKMLFHEVNRCAVDEKDDFVFLNFAHVVRAYTVLIGSRGWERGWEGSGVFSVRPEIHIGAKTAPGALYLHVLHIVFFRRHACAMLTPIPLFI